MSGLDVGVLLFDTMRIEFRRTTGAETDLAWVLRERRPGGGGSKAAAVVS